MNVISTPTVYEVTAYPYDDANRESYSLRVEHRGGNRWAVTRGRLCFARNGGATWEPIPSERTDEWLANYRFTFHEAMAVAEREAPKLCVNGVSVADAIAQHHPAPLAARRGTTDTTPPPAERNPS